MLWDKVELVFLNELSRIQTASVSRGMDECPDSLFTSLHDFPASSSPSLSNFLTLLSPKILILCLFFYLSLFLPPASLALPFSCLLYPFLFLFFLFLCPCTQLSIFQFSSPLFKVGGCNNGLHSSSVSIVRGGPLLLFALQAFTSDNFL